MEAKIERGSKHEDISYQLDLSADVLREIIRGYPVKEVNILFNCVSNELFCFIYFIFKGKKRP